MSIATLVTGSKLRSNLYLNKNNILGLTMKNHRNRFLIPSNQNLFSAIKVMSPTYTRVIHLVSFLFFLHLLLVFPYEYIPLLFSIPLQFFFVF